MDRADVPGATGSADAKRPTDAAETAEKFPEPAALAVRRYCVAGRVQGVGFRWFVHREAATLGLRGWVRNTEAGAVELVAAGSPDGLDALLGGLERGSRGSRVDRVVAQELPLTEAATLGAFTIEGAW